MKFISVAFTALALLLGVSACTRPTTLPSPQSSPSAVVSLGGDPIPVVGEYRSIASKGGRYEGKGVSVEVPAGAVPEASTFRVAAGAPIGPIRGLGDEIFGVPLSVEHDTPLAVPFQVSWDVAQLSEEQRASLRLVRWDDQLGVWWASDQAFKVEGDTLTAAIDEFSFWTWVSSGATAVTQTVGQWFGKRADAPSCASGGLPPWVTTVVRPDADQPAMPIRTCTEPDKNDVLTVRVANNRPYTQALDLTSGHTYAWRWAGDEDLTVSGIIRGTVNRVMSHDTSLVMAPIQTTAVGLGRPATAGAVQVVVEAGPTFATISADVLVGLLENVFNLDDIGGLDSETLNAFVQTVYDCGGKQALASRELAGSDTVLKAIDTVRQCADSDAVMNAIENGLRAQIAKGGKHSAQAVKTNRLLKGALGKLTVYLTAIDFASYGAELASSGAIGHVKVTVHGVGAPPSLGAWTATCTDPDADSTALYKNLSSQEAYFAHQGSELSDKPTWKADTVKAVQPLKKCTLDQAEAVAKNVESTWGDPRAARVAAESVRALSDTAILNSLLPANICGDPQSGWEHGPIQLRNGEGVARESDGAFGGASILGLKIVGRADLNGDGTDEVVLALRCAGSEPERCCAGRTSMMTVVTALNPLGEGRLKAVAPSLLGGATPPGDELGPADRSISSVVLEGGVVVTSESIIYPENYTAAQVGGSPGRTVRVEYRLKGGQWIPSRP